MANEPALTPRQLEEQRTRVIDALTQHFAQDDLTMEQLERKLEAVYAAQTSSALVAVLDGLPSLGAPVPQPVAVAGQQQSSSPMVRPQDGYRSRTLVALMSGVTRKGPWTVPRQINALAMMGGIELDFRSAHFTSPITEINIVAIMGGAVVMVPPGVRVESDGFAIMGGFDDAQSGMTTTDPNAPVIRLRGFALMGGVEVRVVDPRVQLLDSGQPAPQQ